MPRLFLMKCLIERGGFSSERTFEIESGTGKLVGTADVAHLCDSTKQPLNDDEPPFGEKIDGYVKCRVIRKINDQTVLVDLPSTDVAHVSTEELEAMAC